MRIRTIKPEFWTSLTLAELTDAERLTFIGLWNYADDEGRGHDDPRLLKAALWPLSETVTADDVEAHLNHIQELGLIARYSDAAGRNYFAVTHWDEHQSISRPTPSRLPEPSVSPHGVLAEDSTAERKGKEQGTGKGKELARLTPQQRMFGEVCLAMGYPETLPKDDAREVGGVSRALIDKGLDPEQVPQFVEWLTGPESPIVNGTRITLHSLPKWVKDWRTAGRYVVKPAGPKRNVENILALAERMEAS